MFSKFLGTKQISPVNSPSELRPGIIYDLAKLHKIVTNGFPFVRRFF